MSCGRTYSKTYYSGVVEGVPTGTDSGTMLQKNLNYFMLLEFLEKILHGFLQERFFSKKISQNLEIHTVVLQGFL